MQFILITIVSIFIDIYSYKSFNIADAIFDTGITCIPVWLLSQTDYWLYVLIILLVNFIVVLTVNFNFRFSIKSEKIKIPITSPSNFQGRENYILRKKSGIKNVRLLNFHIFDFFR